MRWLPQLQSTRWIWIAFTCCACLVLAAMLWLTRSVIRMEKERATAEVRAEIQERVRLSLWQMDSLGVSILLEENSIPPEQFLKFAGAALPAEARFETQDGLSLQCEGNAGARRLIDSLLPELASAYSVVTRQQEVKLKKVAEAVPEISPRRKVRGDLEAQTTANLRAKQDRSAWMNNAVLKQKAGYATQALDEIRDSQLQLKSSEKSQDVRSVKEFKAARFEGSLFLIRQGIDKGRFVQGSLVDEVALIGVLLAEVKSILPEARLVPVAISSSDSFVLSSFPLQLVPGGLGMTPASIPRTILSSLAVGWLAVGIALLIASFLISRVMELSERRASFVSAVTHELRTPLTTFRLYSEMLSEGAVKEEKRSSYLSILSREADRLSHLVENVLSFSQIERGSARSKVERLNLNELLESYRDRFETRLLAANLELKYDLSAPKEITVDSSAVEHILFNLIDNAAKYAARSEPAEVVVISRIFGNKIEIEVSDYGPGISKEECGRIFKPFHKSAKQASETKPGVGLGLALSKRLARSMDGNIACEPRGDGGSGARFILTLPIS